MLKLRQFHVVGPRANSMFNNAQHILFAQRHASAAGPELCLRRSAHTYESVVCTARIYTNPSQSKHHPLEMPRPLERHHHLLMYTALWHTLQTRMGPYCAEAFNFGCRLPRLQCWGQAHASRDTSTYAHLSLLACL